MTDMNKIADKIQKLLNLAGSVGDGDGTVGDDRVHIHIL